MSLKFGGGGVVKKGESPDFRSPEVGISEMCFEEASRIEINHLPK